MDLALISQILTALSTFFSLTLAIYVLRKTNRVVNRFDEISDSAGQFLRFEQDEEGNVLLDARLAGIIKGVSSGLAQSLKMSALGSLSGPARLEKGLKGAIAADVVDNKMPILGLIGDFVGINTNKYIKKHPEAMLQLARQFAPQLQGFMKSSNPGQSRGNDGVGYDT